MAGYNDAIDRSLNLRPADLQATAADAADAANQTASGTFVVKKEGYDVIVNKVYPFSFSYLYEDPDNPSEPIVGPRSANFLFTLQTPDLTKPVTNLVVTPGLLSYGVKWDLIDKALPANKWLIDIQIYESLTGAFAGEEYLVWNGNGNSATILVSNTANRWIRVDTRDQDYRKKSVTYGPFKATDPIVVDISGPDNVTSVNTADKGIDTSGYLGFNAYANISWPAVTGGGIRGYRIRFSNDNGATYSYVDSPGTGTTYKLAGLAIGSTYKIAVATYDEYNNTSSQYVAGADVKVDGTPSVSNFIKGGPFEFGVGVGSVSTNKGLYFDASNYWYINATNSARLKVGGETSNYLLWDGTKFTIDGDISARGGTFSGNVFMSNPSNGKGASIYSGTIDAATGNLTGNGFALNSTGLKVANGTKSVTISAADGTITANGGSIGSWNITDTTLSKNNIILDSAGTIQIGSTAAQSVYLKSSGDYVMWAGNNTPDAQAKFRVHKDGTLYASGAVFTGYATTASVDGITATAAADATTKANAARVAAISAAATDATTKAEAAKTAAVLASVAKADFNKEAIIAKINNSTNTTTIEGGIIRTGTISASAVVTDFISAFSINASKITTGTISGVRGVFTDGEVGGFVLGNADLTASTSKLPRIMFGNKILIGYDGGTYTLNAGNPRGSAGDSFYVNTNTNVFRFAADSASRSYAAEIRNDIRARDFRYIAGGGLVNDTSSRRFKENITYAPKSYYDRVLDIDPAFYTYKYNHPETEESVWGQHGFGPIVEDLEDAGLGMFVQRNLSGQPTSLKNEHKIPMLLIPIVRELKEKINAMEQKILELESR